MDKKHLVILGAVFLLLTGCQEEQVEETDQPKSEFSIKMKTPEEQQKIAETYTYEDYKKVFDEAVAEAEEYKEDEELTKWIVRTLAQEKLAYAEELPDEQVVKLARQTMKEEKVWKEIAYEKYKVEITDKEIDDYIKDGPDSSDLPAHNAYAEALGLTLEELNHEYDRELYEKNLIWMKLRPILEEEYGVTDREEIIQRYNEEVNAKLR